MSPVLDAQARCSTQRVGTRFNTRGADPRGGVANCVETEQLLSVDDGAGASTVCSYVQIRGSVPLLWEQPPTLKYTPKAYIDGGPKSAAALERHVRELLDTYGSVVAVNLVNSKKWEGRLGAVYAGLMERLRGQADPSALR